VKHVIPQAGFFILFFFLIKSVLYSGVNTGVRKNPSSIPPPKNLKSTASTKNLLKNLVEPTSPVHKNQTGKI
jgi:hypothetical protein